MNWVEFWKFLGAIWAVMILAGAVVALCLLWSAWVFPVVVLTMTVAAAAYIGRTS